ncbi:hypothetical protein SY83_07045 [Paenibacillus swuensis]|uniref:Rubrerythrin diiron-binding domain-containing protein n=1 Tax=Paenibacillus swuensis TaxID=1178515 RepID=A0A172TG93_9BACL|nr:hypothetical protein [Paenibacillus swuensis]ANE46079.1 hypothetical protein SY83_07045 [Paenibacillus swuensis]
MEGTARKEASALPLMHGFGKSFAGYHQFVAGLREALQRKTESIGFYDRLEDLAPTEFHQRVLAGLRNDEVHHFNLLHQMYTAATGKRFERTLTKPLFRNYSHALQLAFVQEVEAGKIFRKLLGQLHDTRLQMLFCVMMADEALHTSALSFLKST